VTDWLAAEIEGSLITADFEKSPADTFGTPATLHESGLSDIAGSLRLRFVRERGSRPEFFGSVEVLPPQHGNKVLIGDAEWDVKGEIGAVRQGGAPDDYGLDAAAHWRIARGLDLKLFSFVGLLSKATDWEAQAGLMWTLPQ